MTIKVHTITPECKLTKDALNSGYDLKANITEPVTIEPGGRALIPCGIKLQIPLDYEAQVRPRSGLAIKHGITVLNAPGTIDAGYRGEVGVIIYNAGHVPFTVSPFDRIAQLVFAHVVPFDFWECSETDLSETKRGVYGFGSTGTGYII